MASPQKLKSLPPTSESLAENFKRGHFHAIIWNSALQSDPPALDPTEYGWIKDEKTKTPVPVTLK